ncbi:MAG: hypothetical protein J6Q69_02280 [Clostridia bacterium]|nr:hypothetical protein [Clostridia bacterium]
MAAIFAIERNGVVYLGADAVRTSSGDVTYYVNSASNLKLTVMPSGVVVASVGYMAPALQLTLRDEWFETEEGEAFDKRFIVTKIIPRFYEAIKDRTEWDDRERHYCKSVRVSFLIAKGSDIYAVFSNLSVTKCDGLAALTEEDADSIMCAYANACRDEDPERIIKKTFAFASAKSNEVSAHGYIINTKDFTLKSMEDVI